MRHKLTKDGENKLHDAIHQVCCNDIAKNFDSHVLEQVAFSNPIIVEIQLVEGLTICFDVNIHAVPDIDKLLDAAGVGNKND